MPESKSEYTDEEISAARAEVRAEQLRAAVRAEEFAVRRRSLPWPKRHPFWAVVIGGAVALTAMGMLAGAFGPKEEGPADPDPAVLDQIAAIGSCDRAQAVSERWFARVDNGDRHAHDRNTWLAYAQAAVGQMDALDCP